MSIIPSVDSQECSQEDASEVLELVLSNQMSTFSALELVSLGNNIKAMAAWISNNKIPLAATRRKDDTFDWYFPIFLPKFVKQDANDTRANDTHGSWLGIHHPSGEIQPLFSLAYLPPIWFPKSSKPLDLYNVLASSGGLLLITTRQIRRSLKGSRNPIFRRDDQPIQTSVVATPTFSQTWRPLLVNNPLIKEWKELPPLYEEDCRDVGLTWCTCYGDLQAHLVVDDEANNYKVILVLKHGVCVYNSTSNNWTCKAFPWSAPWDYNSASACRELGCLYFANLEILNYLLVDTDFYIREYACLRVFEMDEDVGTWKPPIRNALRSFFEVPQHDHDYGFRLSSSAFKLVDYMSSLYAIILAKIGNVLDTELEIRHGSLEHLGLETSLMPLQFHILKLQGDASLPTHGMLRIHLDPTKEECVEHKLSLLEKMERDHCQRSTLNWFRCIARGRSIWVTWDDFLLQYDVVSRHSTTRILPNTLFTNARMISYKPSFHMKP